MSAKGCHHIRSFDRVGSIVEGIDCLCCCICHLSAQVGDWILRLAYYTMLWSHCPKAKVPTVILRAVLLLVSMILVVTEFPATKLLAVESPSMDGILDTELPVGLLLKGCSLVSCCQLAAHATLTPKQRSVAWHFWCGVLRPV